MTQTVALPTSFASTGSAMSFGVSIWDEDSRLVGTVTIVARNGRANLFDIENLRLPLEDNAQATLTKLAELAAYCATPRTERQVRCLPKTTKQRVRIVGRVVGYQFNQCSKGARITETSVFGIKEFHFTSNGSESSLFAGFSIWKGRLLAVVNIKPGVFDWHTAHQFGWTDERD